METLDFVTSVGHGSGPGDRARLGLRGKGPVAVITDLGVLTPDPATCELTLTSVHPGVEVEAVRAATGWPLRVAPDVGVTRPPDETELSTLRELERRTAAAHGSDATAVAAGGVRRKEKRP